MSRETVLIAARDALLATEQHVCGMRGALLACVEGRGQPRPDWDEALKKDPDWCPPPSPSFVAMAAAYEALRVACALMPSDATDELTLAARDYLAEKKESWHGYRPEVPEEVARAKARSQRHADVRDRLAALVGIQVRG